MRTYLQLAVVLIQDYQEKTLFEINNIKMASYSNISRDLWEKYAQEACFAVNQNVKQQAQQFFYIFLQRTQIDVFIWLIERGSDLLLFVIFSYVYKNPQLFLGKYQNFLRLLYVLQNWQMQELRFARVNAPLCEDYVTKTIMAAMGVLMKILFQNKETMNVLINSVSGLTISYFKVYLLKSFVEAVQNIDNQIGYLRFRTMMYNFQEIVMPMICQNLIPFFENFQVGVRISELSLLQENLALNDHKSHPSNAAQLSLSKEQDVQSQLVLMLLKKIVQFNYNITYAQYESQQAIETCLVTFPAKVMHKIVNHEFLSSLFYFIFKVCETKIGEKKDAFLLIVLQCLARIMQSRLGFLTQGDKQKFIKIAVKGITHLMDICQQLQSRILLQSVLMCNKKLFMSMEVLYIEKVLDSDEQLRAEGFSRKYLRGLSWMITNIIKRSLIQVNNFLLNEALEVACKMVTCVSKKGPQIFQTHNSFYQKFIIDIISCFISSLCQKNLIFTSQKSIWISQNKQEVAKLFYQFKIISSFSYGHLFWVLDGYFERYFSKQLLDLVVLANILYLLSELVDHNFLDRNVTKATNKEVDILANIIKKATAICTFYVGNNQNHVNKEQSDYLDVAVLFFAQAILVVFLGNFELEGETKIKQRLYIILSQGVNYWEFIEKINNNSQQTILVYLNLILAFISKNSVTPGVQMLYSLQVIEKVFFKLKRNMKRQNFLKSNVLNHMLNFFQPYFFECYPSAQMMAKVGRLIVILNFDDVMDEYKFRINKFIDKLPRLQPFHTFYYLIGIFDAIQSGNILKYFYNQLNRKFDLHKFLTQVFETVYHRNAEDLYTYFCRFCKVVLLNKGLKTSKNSMLLYELFNLLLPYLVHLLKKINTNPQMDVDDFGEGIFELTELFCGFVNGTNVNIFVLVYSCFLAKGGQEVQPSLAVQYLMEFIKLLVALSKQLRMHPQLQLPVLNCFLEINKELLQFMLDNQDPNVASVYSIVLETQIELANGYISLQLNGNRLIQDKLLKAVDSLRVFYLFLNRKIYLMHKPTLVAQLKRYQRRSSEQLGYNWQKKHQQFAFYAISLILTTHRYNNSYIRCFAKLFFEFNKHFQHILFSTFSKFNICNKALNQIGFVLESQKNCEENFTQKFKTWVKEFDQFK